MTPTSVAVRRLLALLALLALIVPALALAGLFPRSARPQAAPSLAPATGPGRRADTTVTATVPAIARPFKLPGFARNTSTTVAAVLTPTPVVSPTPLPATATTMASATTASTVTPPGTATAASTATPPGTATTASTVTPPSTATPAPPSPTGTTAASPTASPATAPIIAARSATATVAAVTSPTTATASAAANGAGTLPIVYYQDGRNVYAVNPWGTGRTLLATLPQSNTIPPQLMGDGRLLYPTSNGFAAINGYSQMTGIATPTLGPGEQVWSVVPSPNGTALAWEMFTQQSFNVGQPDAYRAAGTARVVVSGRFGGDGPTVMTATAQTAGQMPIIAGWRPTSPYGSGDATLLLQNTYSASSLPDNLLLSARRGLVEYDPAIHDVVNDYLPPTDSSAIPAQRDFTVSPDGAWAVYGDSFAFPPSGEDAMAQKIVALNLNTNAVAALDVASAYPTQDQLVTLQRRRVGKRVLTTRTVEAVRLYQYVSHHAAVAPDDAHILYTVLTVSYPTGARVPRVRERVMLATMANGTHRVLDADARAEGWLNGRLAVVARADGLYSIDIGTGAATRLVRGNGASLHFIGVR